MQPDKKDGMETAMMIPILLYFVLQLETLILFADNTLSEKVYKRLYIIVKEVDQYNLVNEFLIRKEDKVILDDKIKFEK